MRKEACLARDSSSGGGSPHGFIECRLLGARRCFCWDDSVVCASLSSQFVTSVVVDLLTGPEGSWGLRDFTHTLGVKSGRRGMYGQQKPMEEYSWEESQGLTEVKPRTSKVRMQT